MKITNAININMTEKNIAAIDETLEMLAELLNVYEDGTEAIMSTLTGECITASGLWQAIGLLDGIRNSNTWQKLK